MRPSLLLLAFFLLPLTHANAHICEGDFNIVPDSIKIEGSRSDFTGAVGEVGGSVCPKNLTVELFTLPGGAKVLSSTSSDLVGISPHDKMLSALSAFSGDNITLISSGFILAGSGADKSFHASLDETSGNAKATRWLFPFAREVTKNQVTCDQHTLQIFTQLIDQRNHYSVNCIYLRR